MIGENRPARLWHVGHTVTSQDGRLEGERHSLYACVLISRAAVLLEPRQEVKHKLHGYQTLPFRILYVLRITLIRATEKKRGMYTGPSKGTGKSF